MKGEELKTTRNELGLTQQELAEELEIQRNTVARYEREVLVIPKTVELAVGALLCQHRKTTKKKGAGK